MGIVEAAVGIVGGIVGLVTWFIPSATWEIKVIVLLSAALVYVVALCISRNLRYCRNVSALNEKISGLEKDCKERDDKFVELENNRNAIADTLDKRRRTIRHYKQAITLLGKAIDMVVVHTNKDRIQNLYAMYLEITRSLLEESQDEQT